MPLDSLADFVHELEDARDLVRVSDVVEPELELAEIVRQAAPRGGPAVLFEQVRGSPFPVVANLLGAERRLCRAVRVRTLDELTQKVADLLRPEMPRGWLEAVQLVPRIAERAKLPPRIVKTGLCQQVVRMGRDVDLGELPAPRSWPGESGRVITAGQIFTQQAAESPRSCELVPLEVRGRQTLAVHWSRHHALWRRFAACRREGRPLPVAVALGGDPAQLAAAFAPLPHDTEATLLTAFLRGANVDLVKCRSHDLHVPADADFVIEGFLDPATPAEPCGPIALPTGFYSVPEECPLLHVSAITHRANPLFPVMIPQPPPSEHTWLTQCVDRLMLPAVKRFLPEVVDLHRPEAWSQEMTFVSIRKEHPQQARKVLNAVWGLDGLSLSKMVVVVDEGVDVRREEDVWRQVAANVHPGRDVVQGEGPAHPHDHAAPLAGVGQKLGLDATRKLPEEGHRRPWPAPLESSRELAEKVRAGRREPGLPEALP